MFTPKQFVLKRPGNTDEEEPAVSVDATQPEGARGTPLPTNFRTLTCVHMVSHRGNMFCIVIVLGKGKVVRVYHAPAPRSGVLGKARMLTRELFAIANLLVKLSASVTCADYRRFQLVSLQWMQSNLVGFSNFQILRGSVTTHCS